MRLLFISAFFIISQLQCYAQCGIDSTWLSSVRTIETDLYKKSDDQIAIPLKYRASRIRHADTLKSLDPDQIKSVKLVYSKFRVNKSFSQVKLNTKRLCSLEFDLPGILNKKKIEWEFVEQSGCLTSRECDTVFHGFIIDLKPSTGGDSLSVDSLTTKDPEEEIVRIECIYGDRIKRIRSGLFYIKNPLLRIFKKFGKKRTFWNRVPQLVDSTYKDSVCYPVVPKEITLIKDTSKSESKDPIIIDNPTTDVQKDSVETDERDDEHPDSCIYKPVTYRKNTGRYVRKNPIMRLFGGKYGRKKTLWSRAAEVEIVTTYEKVCGDDIDLHIPVVDSVPGHDHDRAYCSLPDFQLKYNLLIKYAQHLYKGQESMIVFDLETFQCPVNMHFETALDLVDLFAPLASVCVYNAEKLKNEPLFYSVDTSIYLLPPKNDISAVLKAIGEHPDKKHVIYFGTNDFIPKDYREINYLPEDIQLDIVLIDVNTYELVTPLYKSWNNRFPNISIYLERR